MIAAGSIRILSGSGAAWRAQGAETGTTTEGWQDKSAHIARRLVGCFSWIFWRAQHIAKLSRNVHYRPKYLNLQHHSHIAGTRHAR